MPTFDEAMEHHASMEAVFGAIHTNQTHIGVTDEAAAHVFCEEVWEAIVTGGNMSGQSYGAQLEVEMPLELMQMVRAQSEIAAAFAFCAAVSMAAKHGPSLQAAVETWKLVAQQGKLAETIKNGYGCSLDPSWEMARELSSMPDVQEVEKIARMAGDMHELMTGRRKVKTDEHDQVADIETGGDPSKLLASEIALLGDESTSDLQAIKILEKAADQYEYEGERPGVSGPLVILVDESSSMSDDSEAEEYTRNTWAKAALVAMVRVAWADNRMCSCVHFATSCSVTRLAPGDGKSLLDASRHFLNGGTSIGLGLSRAWSELKKLRQEGHVGADVVLITDGEDYDHDRMEKTLNLMQADGVKLWTVGVEMDIDQNSPIHKRATEVMQVGRNDRVAAIRLAQAANAQVSNPNRGQGQPPPQAPGGFNPNLN